MIHWHKWTKWKDIGRAKYWVIVRDQKLEEWKNVQQRECMTCGEKQERAYG